MSSTVKLWFFSNSFMKMKSKRLGLLNYIKEQFPEITSLLYTINNKGNETIFDLDIITFSGADCIYEEMEGLKFKIGPKSFYQTN